MFFIVHDLDLYITEIHLEWILFIMSSFNLQESGDLVFVEVSLKPEICELINVELEREIGYWKSKATGNLKLLEEKAPKRRKIKRKKHKNQSLILMTSSKGLSFQKVSETIETYVEIIGK